MPIALICGQYGKRGNLLRALCKFYAVKFLIVQTAFIGDVILATPIGEKLHRRYPDARIDFLVRRGNEGLFAGHPFVHRVWVWDKKRDKYSKLWQLILQIRQERYDCVINCQRFAASGLLTVLSGAPHTVGFAKNPLSRLFSRRVAHVINQPGAPVHEVMRNLSLIEHLTDGSFQPPRLYPTEADVREALTVAPSDKPWVCIAPTSVWFTKQLPAHKWLGLIRRMPKQYAILLLGGPADVAACEAIARQAAFADVRNAAGRLSLLASAALMQRAAMNYVNDSAPLHLASAVNAPVTAVFCSTVPSFGFGPLSDVHYVVEVSQKLPCRPCGLHGKKACPEGHFSCAEGIDVASFPLPAG